MDCSHFVKKLCPWVSEKMVEEYKIASLPKAEDAFKDFSDNQICNSCGNSPEIFCGCSFNQSISARNSFSAQKSCINQNMLFKSALFAASDQDNSDPWFSNVNEETKETRNRLLSMQELSHSESCSLPELNDSEQQSSQIQSDIVLLYKITEEDPYNDASSAFVLPRSSMVLKGHHRSKSDQDGNISFVDKTDSQIVSSSLPKEIMQQHETFNSKNFSFSYYNLQQNKSLTRPTYTSCDCLFSLKLAKAHFFYSKKKFFLNKFFKTLKQIN